MLPRVGLWVCAFVFLGLGVALLFWPAEILANVDLKFDTPTAFADIRADYGGCIFGLGIFLCWCASNAMRVRTGLFCCGLTMSGYAAGRLLSLAIDGKPKSIIFTLIVVEIAAAAACFWLMTRVKTEMNV